MVMNFKKCDMRKLVFCVDCDEVLRGLLKKMVIVYNREFVDNKNVEDIKFFDVSKSFPRIEKETGINPQKWFFELHGKELFLDSEVIDGAWQALDILKTYGTVIILTRQYGYYNKINTLTWLQEHGLLCDDVCFLNDKGLIACDYFIDDNIDNFKKCLADHGVLITAPYNKKFKTFKIGDISEVKDLAIYEIVRDSTMSDCMRFDNLLDFAKYIKKQYGD